MRCSTCAPILGFRVRNMASSTASLRDAKKDLRKLMRSKLSEVSPDDVSRQSATVTTKVLKLQAYADARRIGIFLSMPQGEISTHRIAEDALRQGKQVFVPYIHKTPLFSMEMLELYSLDDLYSLKRDSWGIPSLNENIVAGRGNALTGLKSAGTEEETQTRTMSGLDLIFMPGVAFDSENGRLGHGKGFYDRYLERYRELLQRSPNAKMPLLVGLALTQQLLPCGELVPVSIDDWKIDQVITAKK